MEHQGPDDAEEETEHRESDEPPEHGCEAKPEDGPIRVQGLGGCREHPVGTVPRQGKGYNIGPGGIPRPEKVGPFPELLGVQKRVKRVEEHKEKK